MNLLERAEWQDEVIDAPPLRISAEGLTFPEDVDFTFVGVSHGDRSIPTYEAQLILPRPWGI